MDSISILCGDIRSIASNTHQSEKNTGLIMSISYFSQPNSLQFDFS